MAQNLEIHWNSEFVNRYSTTHGLTAGQFVSSRLEVKGRRDDLPSPFNSFFYWNELPLLFNSFFIDMTSHRHSTLFLSYFFRWRGAEGQVKKRDTAIATLTSRISGKATRRKMCLSAISKAQNIHRYRTTHSNFWLNCFYKKRFVVDNLHSKSEKKNFDYENYIFLT